MFLSQKTTENKPVFLKFLKSKMAETQTRFIESSDSEISKLLANADFIEQKKQRNFEVNFYGEKKQENRFVGAFNYEI